MTKITKGKERECKHKWLPNGTVTKITNEVTKSTARGTPIEIIETTWIVSSTVCEKCGEIKIIKTK